MYNEFLHPLPSQFQKLCFVWSELEKRNDYSTRFEIEFHNKNVPGNIVLNHRSKPAFAKFY
jgi:hypothetical protein